MMEASTDDPLSKARTTSAGADLEDEEEDDESIDQPWYTDEKFSRFWRHYNRMWQWFGAHQKAEWQAKCESYKQYQQSVQNWYKTAYWYYCWYQQNNNFQYNVYNTQQHQTQNFPHGGRFRVPQGIPRVLRRNKRTQSCCSASSRSSEQSSSSCGMSSTINSDSDTDLASVTGASVTGDRQPSTKSKKTKKRKSTKRRKKNGVVKVSREGIVMEITEEMLDFFAKSAKHKRARDFTQTEDGGEERKKEEVYVNLADASSCKHQAKTTAPTERPGARRTAEMQLLYGNGAAVIHGMETAMQLTYDKNCDRKQPKPWPHLPIKITFNG